MKRRFTVVLYWLVLGALLVLFFTNDFGIIDIHKTSIITTIGIDAEGEEIQVTAQVAVPQPSQSGDNVQYTEVQGSGITVFDALNEINAKTGFYPKLLFCNLILLGESCRDLNLFEILSCFYRKNYSELTAQVAMCKGKASEMIAMPASLGSDMNTEALNRVLSDELVKSANVSAVNLKDLALSGFSVSTACFMPYIEANKQGTSEQGEGGDAVGGEDTQGAQKESQSGNSNGAEGGDSSQQSGDGSGNQNGEKVEFSARKTVIFSEGRFKGILDERQSFALDLLKNNIRLAILPCKAEDKNYTMGLKNTSGGVSLRIEDGAPAVTLNFKAKAQIQGIREEVNPNETVKDDVVPAAVLKGAEEEIVARMQSLIDLLRETDSDVLGLRELLHKYHYRDYDKLSKTLLADMRVEYDVKIGSVN